MSRQQRDLYGVFFSLLTVTLLIVLLRLSVHWFRRNDRRVPSATPNPYRCYEEMSTCFMAFALVMAFINTGFCVDATSHGLGARNAHVVDSERALRSLFLSQGFGIASTTASRISVALLEISVFGSVWLGMTTVSATQTRRKIKVSRWMRRIRWRLILLWCLIVLQMAVNGTHLIWVYVQCQPVEMLWRKSQSGWCFSPTVHVYFAYAQGGKLQLRAFKEKLSC
jgi:hypothetical protein